MGELVVAGGQAHSVVAAAPSRSAAHLHDLIHSAAASGIAMTFLAAGALAVVSGILVTLLIRSAGPSKPTVRRPDRIARTAF